MKKTDNYLNKDYSFHIKGLSILGIIGLLILIFFIAPWVSFWLAYFGGWIAKITIGKYLVSGFKLFGITIPINKIPLVAGVLGWIGGFFKTFKYNKNKD